MREEGGSRVSRGGDSRVGGWVGWLVGWLWLVGVVGLVVVGWLERRYFGGGEERAVERVSKLRLGGACSSHLHPALADGNIGRLVCVESSTVLLKLLHFYLQPLQLGIQPYIHPHTSVTLTHVPLHTYAYTPSTHATYV